MDMTGDRTLVCHAVSAVPCSSILDADARGTIDTDEGDLPSLRRSLGVEPLQDSSNRTFRCDRVRDVETYGRTSGHFQTAGALDERGWKAGKPVVLGLSVCNDLESPWEYFGSGLRPSVRSRDRRLAHSERLSPFYRSP
jgi:hypothetical protein